MEPKILPGIECYYKDSNLFICLTARNISGEDLKLWSSTSKFFDLDIKNSDGRTIWHDDLGVQHAIQWWTLKDGEKAVRVRKIRTPEEIKDEITDLDNIKIERDNIITRIDEDVDEDSIVSLTVDKDYYSKIRVTNTVLASPESHSKVSMSKEYELDKIKEGDIPEDNIKKIMDNI
jgi:hypothetical protein